MAREAETRESEAEECQGSGFGDAIGDIVDPEVVTWRSSDDHLRDSGNRRGNKTNVVSTLPARSPVDSPSQTAAAPFTITY